MSDDSKRASNNTFNDLHRALAEEMLDRLENGEEEVSVTKDGEIETKTVKAKPSTLNAIRQFLKDNGIEGPAEETDPVNNLAEKIRQLEEAEDGGEAYLQ